MQPQESLPKIIGEVSISIFEDGKLIKGYILNNALTSDAKNTIVRALGGAPNHIDQIVVKVGGVVLAASPSVTPVYGTGTVIFNAIFNEASFNSVFDELNLNDSFSTTTFSILQGLNITKDDTRKISISWKLTQP